MKLTTLFATTILIAAMTACSNNDNNDGGSGSALMVNPSNVFTGKRPTAGGNITSITYDEQGRVSKMETSDYGTVTFTYRQTRSGESDVLMTAANGQFSYSFQIGGNGFAKSCSEYDKEEDETINWTFRYNNDGQLTYVENAGEDIYDITYTNGDITNVAYEDPNEPEFNEKWVVRYTSSTIATSIENKGCLMFFDETFGIDLDEMALGYYAGLLGKATRHLPISYSGGQESEADFQWTLNDEGYPTVLKYKDYLWETITIAW